MPPVTNSYDASLAAAADALAARWHTADVMGVGGGAPAGAGAGDIEGWSSDQVRACVWCVEVMMRCGQQCCAFYIQNTQHPPTPTPTNTKTK